MQMILAWTVTKSPMGSYHHDSDGCQPISTQCLASILPYSRPPCPPSPPPGSSWFTYHSSKGAWIPYNI